MPEEETEAEDLDPVLESHKERGWRQALAIDAALERGEIDEEGWHRAWAEITVPAYLAGDNPRAQSGHSGDAARWEQARRPLVKAIHHSGTFLDVGCASGLLMEDVQRWAGAAGYELEPYGLDLAPELADLARDRLPHWADRIFTGNAMGWLPPQRFDFVRTGLDYVPASRRGDLVGHLLEHVVAPGGRLIIGMYTEEKDERSQEQQVVDAGYQVAGRHEVPYPDDHRLVRRLFWLTADSAGTSL